MKDFPKAIEAVNRAKETMRRDREWYTHLTFLCESAPVIAWVVNVCCSPPWLLLLVDNAEYPSFLKYAAQARFLYLGQRSRQYELLR